MYCKDCTLSFYSKSTFFLSIDVSMCKPWGKKNFFYEDKQNKIRFRSNTSMFNVRKKFSFFLAKTWLSLSHLRAKKIATSLEFDIGNGNGCDFSANSTPAFLWWDFLDKNKYLGRNSNDFPFFFFLFFLLSIL